MKSELLNPLRIRLSSAIVIFCMHTKNSQFHCRKVFGSKFELVFFYFTVAERPIWAAINKQRDDIRFSS